MGCLCRSKEPDHSLELTRRVRDGNNRHRRAISADLVTASQKNDPLSGLRGATSFSVWLGVPNITDASMCFGWSDRPLAIALSISECRSLLVTENSCAIWRNSQWRFGKFLPSTRKPARNLLP